MSYLVCKKCDKLFGNAHIQEALGDIYIQRCPDKPIEFIEDKPAKSENNE